jgi:hypothetical protein
MSLKSFLSHFSKTSEVGSRVLMSNPRIAWLAQLVTRDRISWRGRQNKSTLLGAFVIS